MSLRRLEHIGIIVEDISAAIEFFVALGMELEGEGSVQGEWVDRVIAVGGSHSRIAQLKTPDGHSRIELSQFVTPPSPGVPPPAASNVPGIRHLAFVVEDVDASLTDLRAHGAELVGTVERYKDVYRLCYVRGPEGIIIELAEELRPS